MFGVAPLVMSFSVDLREVWGDVLYLVVNHPFERGGVAAERNRREIHQQVAADDGLGDGPVFVVDVAHSGAADPAEEVASAVADLPLAQDKLLHVPAAGLEFRG